MSEEKKRLPVGVENFEQLIKDNPELFMKP